MALRHFLVVVAGAAAFFVSPLGAQVAITASLPTTCKPGVTIDCVRAMPVVNPDGTNIGGGSGGGGDASASNQATQISAEQAMRDRIGDTASPIAGSVNARLSTLNTTLGTPFQAGGSIGNTAFGATQSGAWDLRNITGSIPLAPNAATASGQASELTALSTLNTSQGGTTSAVQALAPKLDTLASNTAAQQLATTTVTGTLSAAGQTIDVPLNGSASGLWAVTSSNFVGTVVSEGCLDATCTAPGGRLLFKSGVGSIGTNAVTFTGASVAREYRVVGGGNRIRLRVTSYTAGTLSVTGYAQPTPNIVFVNGPVHNADEEAVRASRGFTASSGAQSVAAGSYLNAKLCNPAASGVNMFFVQREFNSNLTGAQTPAEYQVFSNPTTVPTTTGTISNRWVGAGVASAATFQYQASTTNLAGGTSGVVDFIPTNGEGREIGYGGVLTPGNCIGYSIGGSGGGLAAATRLSVRLVWYEESVL